MINVARLTVGIIIFVWCGHFHAIGQVGISFKYADNQFTAAPPADDQSSYMPKIGINYWFRLRDIRIEFLPEITVGYASKSLAEGQYQKLKLGVGGYVLIYPLDLMNDCDCPTFSKKNNLLKNGWFVGLMLNGGFLYDQFKPTANVDNIVKQHGFIGAGATTGIDIGINDLVTLSPYVQLTQHYYPGSSPFTDPRIEKMIAIRCVLRFDYR